MSLENVNSIVINICQNACEHFAKRDDYNTAHAIYQGLIDAPWLDDDERKHVQTKKRHMEASMHCYFGHQSQSNGDLVQATDHLLRSCALAEESGNKLCAQQVYCTLGNMLISVGQYQQAASFLQQHLDVAVEIGDKRSEIIAYKNLANLCLLLCEYSSGIEYAKLGLKVSQDIGEKVFEFDIHIVLGQLYDHVGKISESIAHSKEALDLAKTLKNKRNEGRAYAGLGNAYYSLADFDNSLASQEKHLEIALDLRDEQMIGVAYTGLGLVHHSRGDNATAIPLHEKALEIAKAHGDKRGQGTCYGNLGNAALALSDYPKAIDNYSKCLELSKEFGNKQAAGMTYHSLGNIYYTMGDYRQALEYQKKALNVAKETGARGKEANALEGIGNVHYSLEEFELAIESYEECLKICIEVGDKIGGGNAQGNLGNTYDGMGIYTEAVVRHKEHLRIAKDVGNKPGEARAHGNLGIAYYWLNDQNNAILHHDEHLRIAIDIKDKMSEGRSYGNLANSNRELGNSEKAFEYYAKQVSTARAVNDRQGEANAFYNKATLYKALEDWAKAEGEIKTCIEKYEQIRLLMRDEDAQKVSIGDKHVRAHKQLALILLRQERQNEAFLACDIGRAMALKDLLRNRFDVKSDDTHETFVDEEEAVQKCLQSLQQNPGVTTLAFSILFGCLYIWVITSDGVVVKKVSPDDKLFFERLVKTVTSALTVVERDKCVGVCEGRDLAMEDVMKISDVFALQPDKCPKALKLPSEGRDMGLEREDEDEEEKEEEEEDNGQGTENGAKGSDHIAKANYSIGETDVTTTRCSRPKDKVDDQSKGPSCTGREMTENGNDTKDCVKETDDAPTIRCTLQEENRYESKGSSYSEKEMKASADQTKDPKGVIDAPKTRCSPRENYVDEERKKERKGMPGGGDETKDPNRETDAPTTRCILPEDGDEDTENPLSELYTILVKPVSDLLRGDHLLIIPEGFFFMVPFSALVDPQGRFLTDRFSIQISTSLQTLSMYGAKVPEELGGALIIGNPKLGRVSVRGKVKSPRHLPGAEKEAHVVARCFNATALVQEEATKTRITRYLPKASVIHIAAHGDSLRGEIYLAPSCPRGECVTTTGDSVTSTKECVTYGGESEPLKDEKAMQQSPVPHEEKRITPRDQPAEDKSVPPRENRISTQEKSPSPQESQVLPHGKHEDPEGKVFPPDGESISPGGGSLPTEEDFLLTCADIAKLHLQARLVVLSCCQTASGKIRSAEGVVGIARSFLGAGAASVLVTLWAISDEATELFMGNFYKFLLQGLSCCAALRKSMDALRQTGRFKGAANWAPFYVIGQDVKLSASDVEQIRSNVLF